MNVGQCGKSTSYRHKYFCVDGDCSPDHYKIPDYKAPCSKKTNKTCDRYVGSIKDVQTA